MSSSIFYSRVGIAHQSPANGFINSAAAADGLVGAAGALLAYGRTELTILGNITLPVLAPVVIAEIIKFSAHHPSQYGDEEEAQVVG